MAGPKRGGSKQPNEIKESARAGKHAGLQHGVTRGMRPEGVDARVWEHKLRHRRQSHGAGVEHVRDRAFEMEQAISKDDGSLAIVDSEARAAKERLREIAHEAEDAINYGLQDALADRLCKSAGELQEDAMGEVAVFVRGKLTEATLKVGSELAEKAAAPLLLILEAGNLAEGLARANTEVREARTIQGLVHAIQDRVTQTFKRMVGLIDGLDSQDAIDLLPQVHLRLTREQVKREFDELVESAMILHGYSAREAVDHVRARLDTPDGKPGEDK